MMLQQILELKLAGTLEVHDRAALWAGDRQGRLGARAEARVLAGGAEHLHEVGDVREIVGQWCAGEDAREVKLISPGEVEVLHEVGTGPDRHDIALPA